MLLRRASRRTSRWTSALPEGDHLERLPRDVPARCDRHVPAVLFPADHDDRLRLDPLAVGELEPEGRLGAEEVPRTAQDVGGDAEEVLLAGFIRSTTSASNPAEASRTKRRSFAFAIRTEIVFPEESRSRHPSTDSGGKTRGRRRSRYHGGRRPGGWRFPPTRPRLRSSCRPRRRRPRRRPLRAPPRAPSRRPPPGAAVSRIRKGRPCADRYERTRSIRFTTLGPATGLWITSIIRNDYRILYSMRPFFPEGAPGAADLRRPPRRVRPCARELPAAFALAASGGADMIEFDVRLSSDGVPVVFHDDRTGERRRENLAVARTAAARLRTVRLKNGESSLFSPTCSRSSGGRFRSTSNRKRRAGSPRRRRRYRRRATEGNFSCRPGCATSAPLRGTFCLRSLADWSPAAPSASDLAFCLRHGLSSIHPDRRLLTVLRLRKVAASGIPFLPYTVDDPEEAFALLAAGAVGVFSNRAQFNKGDVSQAVSRRVESFSEVQPTILPARRVITLPAHTAMVETRFPFPYARIPVCASGGSPPQACRGDQDPVGGVPVERPRQAAALDGDLRRQQGPGRGPGRPGRRGPRPGNPSITGSAPWPRAWPPPRPRWPRPGCDLDAPLVRRSKGRTALAAPHRRPARAMRVCRAGDSHDSACHFSPVGATMSPRIVIVPFILPWSGAVFPSQGTSLATGLPPLRDDDFFAPDGNLVHQLEALRLELSRRDLHAHPFLNMVIYPWS